MIATWMLYCIAVSLLLGLAALALEHGLRVRDWPVRWPWLVSLATSLILPVVGWLAPPSGGASSALSVSSQSPPTVIELLPIQSSFASVDGQFSVLKQLDNLLLGFWLFSSLVVLAGLVVLLIRMHRSRGNWRTEMVAATPVLISRCTGPAVVGFLRPQIVLPEWVLARDEETRRVVVEHESEHIRAGDPYLLLVAIAALLVMPWNVALWWQIRRLRLAIEVDCDARVLRRQPDVRRYGRLLLEVGQLAAGGHPALAAFSEPRSFLERRIRIMTRSKLRTTWPYAMGFTTVGTLLMVAACETPQPASVGPLGGGEARLSDTTALSKDDPVTLTIAPHGQYALNGQPVPLHQLEQRLQGVYTSRSGERVLHVKTREGIVGYDVVVATNAARQAGVRRISGVAAVADNDTPGAPVVERRWEQVLSPLDTTGMRTRSDTALQAVEHRSSTRNVAPRPGIPAADTTPPSLTQESRRSLAALLQREYPQLLRAAAVEGEVVVDFVVDEQGTPRGIKVVRASHEAFGEAAVKVLGQARFNPARVGTRTVVKRLQLPIAFKLSSRPTGNGQVTPRGPTPTTSPMGDTIPPAITDEFRRQLARTLEREYPPLLRDAGVEGQAIIDFTVDEQGIPRDVKVERATHEAFGKAGVAVMREARFNPARVGSTAVAKRIQIPIGFYLSSRTSPASP